MANIHIGDSYRASKRDFGHILDWYKDRYPKSEVWKRSYFSLKTEWATHNALYALGVKRERTKDVDLNYPQKIWVRVAYTITGCLVWPFIK